MLVAVAIFAWVVERKAWRDSAVVSELLAITSNLDLEYVKSAAFLDLTQQRDMQHKPKVQKRGPEKVLPPVKRPGRASRQSTC